MVFHKHRIVPAHMGGTYAPENVLRVNVAMHAFLHKCLWEQHGDINDFHAWKMLTGLIGKSTQRSPETRAKMSVAQTGNTKTLGRKWSEAEREKRRLLLTPEKRARLSEIGKHQWASGRREVLAAALRKRWADPAERQRQSDWMKEMRRRQKAVH
jgi:hypothetical protein